MKPSTFFVSVAAALSVSAGACGGVTAGSSGGSDAGHDAHGKGDAPATDEGLIDAPFFLDTGPPVDAAKTACPAVYSVYGDTDPADNLGHVDPRLYASGTCSGPSEQFSGVDAGVDASFASTDLTITLQQSALRSGMFVTVIHQTTPFPFDLTTCLESAGHGTGSMAGPDMPGTIALVNDAEMQMFPQVQLGTNFAGTDLLFDVALTLKSSFGLGDIACTFTKN